MPTMNKLLSPPKSQSDIVTVNACEVDQYCKNHNLKLDDVNFEIVQENKTILDVNQGKTLVVENKIGAVENTPEQLVEVLNITEKSTQNEVIEHDDNISETHDATYNPESDIQGSDAEEGGLDAEGKTLQQEMDIRLQQSLRMFTEQYEEKVVKNFSEDLSDWYNNADENPV